MSTKDERYLRFVSKGSGRSNLRAIESMAGSSELMAEVQASGLDYTVDTSRSTMRSDPARMSRMARSNVERSD
jgi:hypothetical protein